jgi:hypothetical protein
MKSSLVLSLLLTALGLTTHVQAQSRTTTATTRKSTTTTTAEPADDAVQKHLLGETADVARLRADELPDLFEHFIASTREERRSWTYRNWADADRVLASLSARYEQVREELPLEERVRIRAFQAEFRTLKGTRKAGE